MSELGSGGAWADQRLTKSEIAADPEAAALVTYFRQVRTESTSLCSASAYTIYKMLAGTVRRMLAYVVLDANFTVLRRLHRTSWAWLPRMCRL